MNWKKEYTLRKEFENKDVEKAFEAELHHLCDRYGADVRVELKRITKFEVMTNPTILAIVLCVASNKEVSEKQLIEQVGPDALDYIYLMEHSGLVVNPEKGILNLGMMGWFIMNELKAKAKQGAYGKELTELLEKLDCKFTLPTQGENVPL